MKVFLAFPFTQLIDSKTGQISEQLTQFLGDVRSRIIERGHDVFLAHYREKWGMELMTAYDCTVDDFNEMKSADLVIAYPGAPISGGVHIELGWASALGKNIVLMLKNGVDYSPLVVGLSTVTEAQIFYYDALDSDEVMRMVTPFLESA